MSCSVFSSTQALMQMFDGKVQEFVNEIENVHLVWLQEIQQEAYRMFSSDFSAEPELMPKTPSQKKSNRRKRVSLGRVEKTAKRRFSKGKRSNLRRSTVSTLNLIAEDDIIPEATTSEVFDEPKCSTRRTKQALKQQSEEAEDLELLSGTSSSPPQSLSDRPPKRTPKGEISAHIPAINTDKETETGKEFDRPNTTSPQHSPASLQVPEAVTKLIIADCRSPEILVKASTSPGRSATKIAIASTPSSTRRSSVHHSLTLRRSLAGLRHSMTQESVRQASRRSFLKKKARMSSSICSSNISEDVIMSDGEEVVENTKGVVSEETTTEEEQTQATHTETPPEVLDKKLIPESEGIRFTRSMAQNTPSMVSTIPANTKDKSSTPCSASDGSWKKNQSHSILRSRPSSKCRGTDAPGDFQSPKKKPSPPKKSQTAIRPNMRSFLHTVQKNQMLMTSSSVGRGSVMKSFIKHTTPLKVDAKTVSGIVERERLKLEAVKKKQEQEEERKRKMEEEKRRKREEMKRKRDERLRKVVEARVKEEQKGEEKKKKIEQKMAQIDEKNDKLRVERLAEEKAKKKVATKRQEELEQRRRVEEEARRKKIQLAEEEERRLQEQQARRRAEEEQERARKLAEARRVHELKKEQEREKELEREKQAAGEKERAEREKALALQREAEKCAREKEKRLLEERRKEMEEKKREEQAMLAEEERAAKQREAFKPEHAVMTPVGKGVALNQTVEIEQSPQSYEITPKGGNKPLVISYNPDNYGMDQNSDDSTDDESAPRKPIPSWAEGLSLKQSMMKQYFNPPDMNSYFGEIEEPRLEDIFDKSKPRFFKRTSSAVWNSPPRMGTLPF